VGESATGKVAVGSAVSVGEMETVALGVGVGGVTSLVAVGEIVANAVGEGDRGVEGSVGCGGLVSGVAGGDAMASGAQPVIISVRASKVTTSVAVNGAGAWRGGGAFMRSAFYPSYIVSVW
jgi:hypothetical protein